MQVKTVDGFAASLGGRLGRTGASTMEYVILAVLIAAACLLGVIVFNRAVVRSGDVANKALSGRANRAGEAVEIYRSDTDADLNEAKKFPREFSDVGR